MPSFFRLGLALLTLLLFPLFTTSGALAQVETDTGLMSVDLDNTFTITEIVAADVDSVAVIIAPFTVGTATFTLNPNGSSTIVNSGTDARFFDVDATGRTAGNISITGAAPNTPLTLSFVTLNDLFCAACSGGNPVITLGSYTSDVGFNPVTDASGDLDINFGFTLTTLAGQVYEDGTYTGRYEVTVSY